MAKTLVILAILLLASCQAKPDITTTPTIVHESVDVPIQNQSPRAQTEPQGVREQDIIPEQVIFWVNTIQIPTSNNYNGSVFIPLKNDKIKTFSGKVGPYFDDPSDHIRVSLCEEYTKVEAKPSCENVKFEFFSGFITFVRAYKSDEFIGGLAAKDYNAYFDVYYDDTKIAASNKAIIRTVVD